MKINPEFSYFITDKEQATNEVIEKLKIAFSNELENNVSLYYQQFLNDKFNSGINITKSFNKLTITSVVKEILNSYFSISNMNATELELKNR